MKNLKLKGAQTIIAAAMAAAEEIAQPMNIAVVDKGGHLIAHVRMDNAWLGSVDISIKKAWTARAFDVQTGALGTQSQPGGQFYGIQETNGGKVIIFAGGIPISLLNGEIVGAIGVSGGTGEQDQHVAEVAVQSWLDLLTSAEVPAEATK